MPTSISWTLNVQITQGPILAVSGSSEIDAYDRVAVTLASGASDRVVELQPGGDGQVRFLLIRSSKYGNGLTYKVNSAANPARVLNDLLFLVGQGGVALLGAPPNTLRFSNSLPEDVTIEILIGRQATT
jgi:hypothetical protein